MSVEMMVSFMPSIAFAASPNHTCEYAVTVTGNAVTWSAIQALSSDDAQYVEVVKKPTCGDKAQDGEAILTCKKTDCDEAFAGHTKTVKITGVTGHETESKEFTAEDLAKKLVEQKTWTQETANDFVEAAKTANNTTHYEGEIWCYYTANVCKICGKVIGVSANSTTTGITGHDHFRDKSSGCNATAKCLKCGKVVAVEFGTNTGTHVDSKKTVQVKAATCDQPAQEKHVCAVCNEPFGAATAVEGSKPLGHNLGTAVAASEATDAKGALKKGYFIVTGTDEYGDATAKYYKYNTSVVVKTGTKDECSTEYRGIKCATCGKYVVFDTNHKVAADAITVETKANFISKCNPYALPLATKHDFKEETVPATCTTGSNTKKTCKKCGYVEYAYHVDGHPETISPEGKPNTKLGHNYVVTEVKGDCAHQGKVVVSCSNKDCDETVVVTDSTAAAPAHCVKDTSGTIYFRGFNDELVSNNAIALPAVKANPANHQFGALTLYKAADCQHKELWAQKCKVCGKIDATSFTEKGELTKHNIVKHEVAATCGTAGYYTEECTLCGKYRATGGQFTTTATADDVKKTETAKPVVKNGAACKFDKWVVTKEATVFEEGVKQLECSVCGTKDATKTIIAKKTVGKPVVKLISKKGKLTVKASAADNATGYEVTYKRAGKAEVTKTYTAEQISKTFRLLKGKKYTVKVTAFASNGTDTVEGATVTKSIKIKK